MTLTRLFVAALALCSLPALAQNHLPTTPSAGASVFPTPHYFSFTPTPHVLSDFPDERRTIHGLPLEFPRPAVLQSDGDRVCYTIHSLKVARDSKDSDATHPVSSSTCLPANQYQTRSAVLRNSSGR